MTLIVCERLDLLPYRLPLTRPWSSARGVFRERCGWLAIAEANGMRGYGDCAPLPEAGTEQPDAAGRRLTQYRTALLGARLDESLAALTRGPRGPTPAADFALDCALCDLASRLAGTSLRRWLAATALDRVPVNGALGRLMETTTTDLSRAALAGLRVVKIKLGMATPEQELGRLGELAHTLPPGLRLRLDANGAWDPGTATRIITALRTLPIESLEEPLREPDWPVLQGLQALAPFALALDESLPALADTLNPARLPVRRVILKPAALGGLRRTLTLARRCQAAQIEVVITSLVESTAGLWPTAQLAAAVASPLPQGLATADWLLENLGPPPPIQDGHLRLPDTAGSGFAPYNPDASGAPRPQ
ncbi:enolase C-terminal domain-like protein [uncultured Thiodictyon sp.]|uniref:mandelate racemase/muconate lactonizing enzyme family protein n=1 Tax=uncultured Thiodictyon sp. TaxID=1846217 RepID=UPI0025E44F0C|nr:enolase C-terminal domain-like protein [uncultured Thiodictyon sp.]